ncbi:MAG: pyridoxamine 5'-phosphate oxidase family protein [Gammaproteobacteria bacterium]|nr:pyridoxamine 5'-phosphate oxidase family protein [Gammaproteobacteria bacterium]
MIELDEDIKRRLESAIEDQKVLAAAYVDVHGKPHISFYGSTHVHSTDQLAMWARNPEGELIRTLPERPDIAFIYGDVGSRVYYTFEGRGRVTTDEAERNRIYDEMHPIERQFDADKNGIAVVVDLDKVTSLSAATGKQVMEREG